MTDKQPSDEACVWVFDEMSPKNKDWSDERKIEYVRKYSVPNLTARLRDELTSRLPVEIEREMVDHFRKVCAKYEHVKATSPIHNEELIEARAILAKIEAHRKQVDPLVDAFCAEPLGWDRDQAECIAEIVRAKLAKRNLTIKGTDDDR